MRRVIRGPVIDDNQFRRDRVLFEYRIDRRPDMARAVVYRDDDADKARPVRADG